MISSRQSWTTRMKALKSECLTVRNQFIGMLYPFLKIAFCTIIMIGIIVEGGYFALNQTHISIITRNHSAHNQTTKQPLTLSEVNEKRVYSQNGEDGIIQSIFAQIGVTDKYFVEFGTQDGSQTNTRNLRHPNSGWNGLLMDGGYEDEAINLHEEFIYDSNIVALFEKYKVPKAFDLLSTDTDFKDFWISESILAAGFRPRVIVSEVNPCFNPNLGITVAKNMSSNQKKMGWHIHFWCISNRTEHFVQKVRLFHGLLRKQGRQLLLGSQ